MVTKFYNIPKNEKIRRELRQEMPEGEARMWKVLRNNNLGYKFRRQYGVGPFVVDFCCVKLRLVIEVDGLSHEDDDVKEYDNKRQKFLESRGFGVIRFNSAEMFTDMQDVAGEIIKVCQDLESKKSL